MQSSAPDAVDALSDDPGVLGALARRVIALEAALTASRADVALLTTALNDTVTQMTRLAVLSQAGLTAASRIDEATNSLSRTADNLAAEGVKALVEPIIREVSATVGAVIKEALG